MGNSKRMGHSYTLPKQANGTTRTGDKRWSELLVFFFIPTLSDTNEANYPYEVTSTVGAFKLDSVIRQSRNVLEEPTLLLLLCRLQVTPLTQKQPPQVGAHKWG